MLYLGVFQALVFQRQICTRVQQFALSYVGCQYRFICVTLPQTHNMPTFKYNNYTCAESFGSCPGQHTMQLHGSIHCVRLEAIETIE